jgi:hypothetical protein
MTTQARSPLKDHSRLIESDNAAKGCLMSRRNGAGSQVPLTDA